MFRKGSGPTVPFLKSQYVPAESRGRAYVFQAAGTPRFQHHVFQVLNSPKSMPKPLKLDLRKLEDAKVSYASSTNECVIKKVKVPELALEIKKHHRE